MDCEEPNRFADIRFHLVGFNPALHHQVKSELVSVGAVYVAHYSPDVTHVIVHNLLYDDPICVAARRDQKALVTGLWVEHSLDSGEPVDSNDIMYRPPKGPNGIPGAEGLQISLTGYQGPHREDIMTMVGLMGAQFSKALAAKSVTHLVCYKFEGEKYELAERIPRIKIVNHQWLQDCLKAWKILPEEKYNISGYELDMMQAVAGDSDEETGGIPKNLTDQRDTNGIPISQTENGKHHDQSVVATERSTLSVQQGMSNSVFTDGRNLPLKPDQVTEYRNFLETEKLRPGCPDKAEQDDKFHLPNQIVNKLPSVSGSSKGTSDSSAKKLSSVNNQKTPGKSGLPLFIGEDLGNLSGPSSKKSSGLHDDCSTPTSSGKLPSTSRTSLHSEKSGNSDRKREEYLRPDAVEKMSSAFVEASSVEAALAGEGSCGLQMTGVKSSDTHTSSKSHKLTASASKRIDAAEPDTPVITLGQSRNGSLNLGANVGIETSRETGDKSSPDLSSVMSNVKTSAPSKQPLALDELQVSGCDKMDADAGLSTGHIAGCTTPDVINKDVQQRSLQGKASVSAETKDSDAMNSMNPELKATDKTGSSVSKPPRKKMMARKTLGSRPKASKKSSDAKKGSLDENLSGVDAVVRPVGQMVREENGNLSAADNTFVPPAVCASTIVGYKPSQKSAMVSDNVDPFNNETEVPPDFVVQLDESAVELSHSTEIRAGETSEVGLPAVMSNAKVHTKKIAVSGRAKGKTALKGAAEEADDAAGRNVREEKGRMKPETEAVTGKKRRGAQLVKKTFEVVKENESIISHDQVPKNGAKHSVALKSRRGTLLLNKQDVPAEVEKENMPAHDRDEGQNDSGQRLEKLPGASNLTEGPMDIDNVNDAVTGNGHCSTKVVKRTGKKRRGTMLLDKAEGCVSLGKDNLPYNGARASNVPQSPVEKESTMDKKLGGKKRRGTLVLNKPESSVEVGNEKKKDDNPGTGNDQGTTRGKKLAGKKRRGTLILNNPERSVDVGKENEPVLGDDEDKVKGMTRKSNQAVRKSDVNSNSSDIQSDLTAVKKEPACFILSGHRLQRKEFQQVIKRLKGKHCRDSHQWSYQATHFVVPDPIRRTEKFFAAAASGRWILKTDYLTACSQAGKFLPEEPYEWHKNELTEDGAINLEAPRKWRHLREKTGHGAFYGMRIVIYGECIAPPLDTLKRVVKAGDGTILATAPPYTRFLKSGVDFAIVSPGMARVDIWVQEFLRHEIPCVLADYLVEYVCKPGYPLDRHVQYNTHEWAAKSFSRLTSLSTEAVADAATPESQVSDDLACQVCGSSDRAQVMLVCGDESGSTGCGVGTHIDCCDPPLEDVPQEDWFCPKCSESKNKRLILKEKMI